MSSSIAREPLTGIVKQNQRVVGAICLPEEHVGEFIDQFNHCYGPLGMRVEVPGVVLDHLGQRLVVPVGGSRTITAMDAPTMPTLPQHPS
ncbi:MAG: hypothetical protein KDB03_12720 [Planctomycetales bacterium]|nr:hypothetical protein [Planctomycetales bacterium]